MRELDRENGRSEGRRMYHVIGPHTLDGKEEGITITDKMHRLETELVHIHSSSRIREDRGIPKALGW